MTAVPKGTVAKMKARQAMYGLVTPRQVAQKYGVSTMELASWRRREIGPPFYNFGRKAVRYDMADVDDWFNDPINAHLHDLPVERDREVCA